MKKRQNQQNTMQELVENENLNRRRKSFTKLSSTSFMNFAELVKLTLKYYLLALINFHKRDPNLEFVKDRENIIKVRVRSRHMNSKTYNCFIEYKPNSNTYEGILRYVCL